MASKYDFYFWLRKVRLEASSIIKYKFSDFFLSVLARSQKPHFPHQSGQSHFPLLWNRIAVAWRVDTWPAVTAPRASFMRVVRWERKHCDNLCTFRILVAARMSWIMKRMLSQNITLWAVVSERLCQSLVSIGILYGENIDSFWEKLISLDI